MLRESFLLSSVTITAPPPPAVATFSAILSAIFWLDQSETSIYCGQVSTNHSSPEGVHVVVPEVVVGVVQAGDHQPAARHLGLDLKEDIRTSLHNRKSHYLTWASATSAMGARAVLMCSMGMQSTYFTGFRPPPTCRKRDN